MATPCIDPEPSGGYRRGDAVTVRSFEEILVTLDADAKLDGLPFMPEMIPSCGRSFLVYRRAEKTCVEGPGIRGMQNTVFLDGLRCDGSAHGGCQRGCLFFWNEAWLKPAKDREQERGESHPTQTASPQSPIPHSAAPACQLPTMKGDRYYCQSTELAGATTDFLPNKLRHYLRDLRLRELTLGRFAYMLWLSLLNRVWRLLHGRGFYQITGEQKRTLCAELNLQPGELVEIRSPAEIRTTLDAQGRNRGLSFEAEMATHCGRRYRVAAPVRKIIAEETGKMVQLRNTVILEGVVCEGICVKNCPRANFLYWREIWLKRV
jgi:hypothetical protein